MRDLPHKDHFQSREMQMKRVRFIFSAIVILSVAISVQGFVKADMNAQAIVDQFNSTSGGTSMKFKYGTNYEVHLTQVTGFGFADTSAYSQGVTGGNGYFRTLCVEPTVGAYATMEATLNYVNGTSSTSNGYSLTIGAAYLYSQFAAGTLGVYSYENTSARTSSSSNLTQAIRILMGITIAANWSANPFLKHLLEINNDMAYWTELYDPNQYYEIIGDYSVFVMNNTEAGTGRDGQDFLYVAKATNSSNVPEPATLLLWGLGSLGAIGIAGKRRVRCA